MQEKNLPSAEHIISEYVAAGLELRQAYFAKNSHIVVETAQHMALALTKGKKILLCGNGGSAADAQHIACEFTNRFLIDRPGLPAIALTTDTSVLTAIGNDFGYENIFSKQIQALGNEGDVFIGISTSGTSTNIIAALHEAKRLGLSTIGLTQEMQNATSEHMAQLCDICLAVPKSITPLIQEVHIAIGHLLCRLVDYYLFENVVALNLNT